MGQQTPLRTGDLAAADVGLDDRPPRLARQVDDGDHRLRPADAPVQLVE